MELTPASAGEILRLNGSNPSLRGKLLRLDRVNGNKRAKIAVELTSGVSNVGELPVPQSPEPVLRRLWGWKTTD